MHGQVMKSMWTFVMWLLSVPHINDGLVKPQLNSGHVWVITFHIKQWMLLYINAQIQKISVSKMDHWPSGYIAPDEMQ